MMLKTISKFVASIIIAGVAGSISFLFPSPVQMIPSFTSFFGYVWCLLYILMGIALFLVWNADFEISNQLFAEKRKKAWNRWSERLWRGDLQQFNVIAIFVVQIALNILWHYTTFTLQNPLLSFFVIIALWKTIIYTIINFYRISKVASWLLVPYLVAVSFGVYLSLVSWLVG